MSFLKGFGSGFSLFGHSISRIINTCLLLVAYFLGIGVTALVARLIGKRFLETGLDKKSFWHDLNLKKKPTEAYYRQF